MPRFDGTGPTGKGPNTGRGKGFCQETQKEYKQTPSKVDKVEVPKKDKASTNTTNK
jgi:hypothetical protein